AVNTRSNAAETRRWARERGFKSLIVVTSNYHMPRATVELSHAMPDVVLIPFAVVGDKWRDEPWWTNGATLRLLLSEYVKYAAAGAVDGRRMVGAKQHLLDARGLQYQGGISRCRKNPARSADRCLETSVDVGDLCTAAALRTAAVHPQARADVGSGVRPVSHQ